MKLIFDQQDLANSVGIVMKAVPSKTTMPILQCILIDASFSQIKFTANDMELGIETIVPGEIAEKGKIALDAKIFSDIVRKLPNSRVTIETNENDVTTITCEKAKFDIPGKSGDDFADLPKIDRNDFISISQLSLREVIRQTIFSTAVNENNKLMTGELFEVSNNKLKVVALDGHRIAIRNLEISSECSPKRVVVPGKTLNEISKILSGEADDLVTIYFSDNYLLFEFNDTVVLSRLIDGEYFKIDQMLSSDYETKIEVNRQEFISCIDRATLLVRESDKMPVIIDITDEQMELQIDSAIGSMDEEIDIEKTGKDITIGFNPKFLLDALRVIDDERVSIFFVNAKAPCFIRDEEGNYIYLILPVNINVNR
ncbi:MAG: DNA polymerase III subunit beta [Eubacterium sp.]|nr:DNA polymerase III subunit beta [Eubacterium sp.]